MLMVPRFADGLAWVLDGTAAGPHLPVTPAATARRRGATLYRSEVAAGGVTADGARDVRDDRSSDPRRGRCDGAVDRVLHRGDGGAGSGAGRAARRAGPGPV